MTRTYLTRQIYYWVRPIPDSNNTRLRWAFRGSFRTNTSLFFQLVTQYHWNSLLFQYSDHGYPFSQFLQPSKWVQTEMVEHPPYCAMNHQATRTLNRRHSLIYTTADSNISAYGTWAKNGSISWFQTEFSR